MNTFRWKGGFSILEISVVMVILSIMISATLVCRKLIQHSKINVIQNDYGKFRKGIFIFYQEYGCIPGLCSNKHRFLGLKNIASGKLSGLSYTRIDGTIKMDASLFDILNDCITEARKVGKLNCKIDTVPRRNCMMIFMFALNYLDTMHFNAYDVRMSQSSINRPHVTHYQDINWDFRYFDTEGVQFLPMEIGFGSLKIYDKRHNLVLVKSNDVDILHKIDSSIRYSGLSSNVTKILDQKFDDGLPYSGNIIGGKNPVDFGGMGCNNSRVLFNYMNKNDENGINESVKYSESHNEKNGCIIAYRIDMP